MTESVAKQMSFLALWFERKYFPHAVTTSIRRLSRELQTGG